jgi:matrix metalloproteinase-14 (membrane-inserted)
MAVYSPSAKKEENMSIVKRILDKVRTINLEEIDVQKIVTYLQVYRYLKSGEFTVEEFIQALLRFQKTFGLEEGEALSPQIVKATEWKRCGCPDNLVENVQDNQKWAFTHLKYYIDDFVPGLTKDEQRFLTKQAATDSSNVCGLTFEEVFNSNQANIVLRTGDKQGLGSSGGVLAYAYLPNNSNHTYQLEAVFDLAELWIKDATKRGILYKNVAAHEIFSGHSVGLMHSEVKSALMAPFYSQAVDKPQKNDDIPRLQARYGKPKIVMPPVEPTPVPDTPDDNPGDEVRIFLNLKTREIEIPGYRIYKA